jgi:hypothetical protein
MRVHQRSFAIGAAVLGLGPWATAAQALTFSDTEFDLGDYAISAFAWPGDVTTFSQSLTGGNPGAAFQDITTRAPATNGSRATNYLVNTQFAYHPQAAGAIEFVDLSIQTFWQSGDGPLSNNGASFVILQGGEFFMHGVSLPSQANAWLTAQASGLVANDFSLVTDPRSRATDPTRHPDFAGGPMQFGFMGGLMISGSIPSFTRTARADNFSVVLTPVPEPAGWALMLGGLLALGALGRQRQAR